MLGLYLGIVVVLLFGALASWFLVGRTKSQSGNPVASIDSLDGLVRAKRQGSASIVNELLSDRNEKGAAAITVTP